METDRNQLGFPYIFLALVDHRFADIHRFGCCHHSEKGQYLDLIVDRGYASDLLDGPLGIALQSGARCVTAEDDSFPLDSERKGVEDPIVR